MEKGLAAKGADKAPKIKINKENLGKFTEYCKSLGYNKVTQDCIDKGKDSKNPVTKKRAVFADNARKWNKG